KFCRKFGIDWGWWIYGMVFQQELLLRLLMGQALYWRWYSDHFRCTAVHTTTTTTTTTTNTTN
ncbi:hypothetical protein BpHYR1_045243, partial [Brachionus plicatilis]